MQFCLNTSTIKPQPLLKKIELAGAAGYDGIELWLNDIYDHIGRGGEVSDVEKALADHGLIVPSVIAIRQWGDQDGWEYELVKDEAVSIYSGVSMGEGIHNLVNTWHNMKRFTALENRA